MSLWSFLRRSRFLTLLFSLSLSAVLLLSSPIAWMQPVIAESVPTVTQEQNQQIALAAETAPTLSSDVRQTVLENGLTVLTKEVHTAPVVTVQVWYKVGSRNEAPGVNGIAHQLEHMMFKGTSDRPIQWGRLFNAIGSQSNAFTSYDQTAYYGTVEREKLRAMLVLESDRMQNTQIDPQQLENEKRVVISELEGYENDPSYRLDQALMRSVFPHHPYGLTVGGTKADVEKFTVEQVRSYYQNYYSPNNAVLIIVGDFQTEPTLQAIKETFGQLANRQSSENLQTPSTPIQATPHPTPIILRQPGSAPLLEIVYPLTSVNHPDVPALLVMDSILATGRSSRFYQTLIESGLASDVNGTAARLKAGGWYTITATAIPGNMKLPQIEKTIQEVIADLQKQGVTPAELNRAKAQFKTELILQSRDINNLAFLLGDNETTAGDYHYTDRLLAAVSQVSAVDVQRVARQYLKSTNRTVGFLEPTQIKNSGTTGTTKTSQTSETFNLGTPLDPSELSKYLPTVEGSTASSNPSWPLPQSFTFSNGLRVLLLPNHHTPTVTLNGFIQAGKEFDPAAKAGLADITATNLMNGTKTKSAIALAEILEDRAVSLSFDASREGVQIDGSSLTPNMPVLINTLADVLKNATFPKQELLLTLQQSAIALKEQLDSPDYLGYRTLQETIYPNNHPFHSYPTESSLKSINQADVVQFYRQHYRPDKTLLVLEGDFDPAAMRSLLEQQLGSWKATGKAPVLNFPPVPLPPKVVQLNRVIPGKTQAITFMGYKGINRQDPRYYTALVLNQILGGDTLSSRLGTELRDRAGLTYGIYSGFQAGKQPGLFVINMQTAPQDTSSAIAKTLAILQQIHSSGVTPAEVDNAKRSLISGYIVALADPSALSSETLTNAVYDLGSQEISNYTQKIALVTPEQVNQVAKELLYPNNIVVVTAGPPVANSR